MITYQEYPNKLAKWGIAVYLDKKLVGYIEHAPEDGYRYAVKGVKGPSKYGDTFDTIHEVKASLEAE